MGANSKNTDADGNQLPDLYEYIYFGFTGSPNGIDSDGDGFSNLEEAKAWTDPNNPDDLLHVSSIGATRDLGSGEIVITWPSHAYVSYNVERNTNGLASSDWVSVRESLPATTPMNTYTDLVNSASAVFYRISVQ